MSVPIRIVEGLHYVEVTLLAKGQTLNLPRVLLDTGSSGSVFKTDDLKSLSVKLLLTDKIRFLRGVGGQEAVVEKTIEALQVGSLIADHSRLKWAR